VCKPLQRKKIGKGNKRKKKKIVNDSYIEIKVLAFASSEGIAPVS
jgi:hypothetical protein